MSDGPALAAVLVVGGLGLLALGGESLVRGASRLAATLGLAPLVVGLTIAAFGTSAPELAVSLRAAFGGQSDMLVGNVVGSNIGNVLLVLGVSALVAPLVVAQRLVRLEVPLMIGVSVLLHVLALDGALGRLDGLLLFGGLIAYLVFAVRQGREETAEVRDEYAREYGRAAARGAGVVAQLGLILVGLALLVAGAQVMVAGAVRLAKALGVGELVIGLTVVAAGTSMPEVATSVVATLRRERDIAVGNVVGSNIFNILGIVGLSAAVSPAPIAVAPAALAFDLPVMIAVAVGCLPILFTDHLVARWEGALFVGYYAAYILYLVLASIEHDALRPFSRTMLAYVLPLTVVTLVVLYVRSARHARQA